MPTFNFDSPINSDKLAEGHGVAYLRGDLAASSPEGYTIEEMKAVSDGMLASTAEVDAAMRKDFHELAPRAQAKMLGLLQKADPEHFGWWTETLIGKAPNRVR